MPAPAESLAHRPFSALLRQFRLDAATLLGTVDGLAHTQGFQLTSVYRAGYDESVHAARTRLGAVAFQAAWQAGHAMTLDQAIEFALT